MKTFLFIGLAAVAGTLAWAQTGPESGLQNRLRGPVALEKEATPLPIPKPVNDDQRKVRAFALQPPIIPHQIENYQIDKNFNKCMTCHAREKTVESGAPMVSVTHFMDREGSFHSEISSRRYFCTQCHVPQMDIKPPVDNGFGEAGSPQRAPVKKK